MSTKTKSAPAITATKFPLLDALRRMAKEAGVPTAEMDALLPTKARPTNKQKQALMRLIEEHRAKAPQAAKGAESKPTPQRKATKATKAEAAKPKAKATKAKAKATKAKTTKPRSPATSSKTPSKAAENGATVERRRVDALRPNKVNREIFSTSLSDEGIEVLVEDIRRRGQRGPIEIMEDGTILDGERRWRAAQALGLEWVDVVVRADVRPDEIEEFVVDSYSSMRNASIEERVRLYLRDLKVLRKRHGRPTGRPMKLRSNDQSFWTTDRIESAAARRVGFSASLAKRAVSIFREGDDSTKADVNAGDLAISAAYARLTKPKPPVVPVPAPPAEAQVTKDSQATSDDDADEQKATDSPQAKSRLATVASGEPKVTDDGPPSDSNPTGTTTPPAPEQRADDEDATASKAGAEAAAHEGHDLDADAEAPPEIPASEDISIELAWEVILDAAADPEAALSFSRELAEKAEVEVWFGGEDSSESVPQLSRLLEDAVDAFAAADAEGANDWLRSFVQDLGQVIERHRSSYQDD